MMTIMHICDWYRPIGGAEKLLFDTLRLLEEQGHTNIIVYNANSDQQPSNLRPEYAVQDLEAFGGHIPETLSSVKKVISTIDRIIEKHKPDICHIHNFQNSYITEYLIKKLPCVRSIHDPRLYCFTYWKLLPDKSICPYPLGRACIKQGCLSKGFTPQNDYDYNAPWALRNYEVNKKIPLLIAESRAQIETLLTNGFCAEQIAWLPNFTPIPRKDEVDKFLKEHFKPDERIVLFVGRASFEKGIQVLLEAYGYLKNKCKLVIITAGPMLDDLKAMASKYSDSVEIIPGLSYEKTRKYYARASVVVVPSVWLENFCLVGLEAFANMKPVIGSNIGGIKDWLKEPETGWLFEVGNARALAEKIDHALSDPERLQEMGRAAYERVCKYYNSELYISRLLNIYQKGIQKYQEANS